MDLETPIIKYFKDNSIYYDDVLDSISELNKIREKLINCGENESGDNILQLYYKYLSYLNSIEMRIPISESEVRIPFTWYDIYKGKKIMSYSLAYEKSCVYFNIGAQYTIEGQREFRSKSDDAIKNACKNFQMAATAFNSVVDIIGGDPSSANLDLSVDNITFLVNIFLGQAQECFYHKATNLPPRILAQLSLQASAYYNISLQKKDALKSFIGNTLLSYVEIKSRIYTALTYYNVSLEKGGSSNYGEQVAFISVAYSILSSIKKDNLVKHISECKDLIEKLLTKVSGEYASIKRDNDKIYYEVVPDNPTIKEVKPKSMVKMIDIPIQSFNDETDPFITIVPPLIRKYDSIYSENKANILRSMLQKEENLNSHARNELYSMGLPGSIESVESPTGIPDALSKKINIIRTDGGMHMIQDRLVVLRSLSEECFNLLTSIKTELDKEEADNNQMRSIYNEKWTRTPSHSLTMVIREEIGKVTVFLETAKKSDAIVMNKVESFADPITKLSTASTIELSNDLPNVNNKKDPAIVKSLRGYILQLTEIFKTRESIISRLRETINKDNILVKLMKSTDNNVIETELEKYTIFENELEATVEAQNNLLRLITIENQKFVKDGDINEAEQKRQLVLQKYDLAFKTYLELRAHFAEGIEFYTKQADKLESIKNRVLDFCLARQTEKEEHVNSIKYYMDKGVQDNHNIYSQHNFNSSNNNPFNY